MSTKFDARQVVSRDLLDQIANATETELDNILRSLNSNDTPPLKFSVTGNNRILSIGSIFVTNPETSKNRTIPTITNLIPNFTSGTVTAPSIGVGSITVSAGSPLAISMSASKFLKVGINVDVTSNIILTAGVAASSLAAATAPAAVAGTFSPGYIVLRTDASNNIQNILNSDLYQYVGGGGGGSGSANSVSVTQAHTFNIGDWLYLNGSTYALAKADLVSTASVVGVVSGITDSNKFTLTTAGLVTGLTGPALTVGSDYFLSAITSGQITVTEPIVISQVSIPVGIAASTTSIYVAIKRGNIVGGVNARTSINLLNNNTTTIQNASAYDSGELTGWVTIAATTPRRFFIRAPFAKNGANNDYNISPSYVGDTVPVGFTTTITAAGLIQMTLPNLAGFTLGTVNFSLNAPAVGTTFPLQIDASNVNNIPVYTPAPLQLLTGTQTVANYLKKLTELHTENANAIQAAATYAHGATVAAGNPYSGGVYSPTQNRIYLVPQGQGNQTNWHYIDCATGTVIAYAHGVTAVNNAYSGGVYSPTQNRIYLVPASQGNQTNWHYINCATGTVVAYAHGVTAANGAYSGGVYSPTQNRIYLVPQGQGNQTNWHYIDCATGTVVAYPKSGFAVLGASYGGAYSPTQNRIYLAPYAQSNDSRWQYIDCATGNAVDYLHGATAVQYAYFGAVYSPTQNRIYLVPSSQGNQANWHYIDCATGNVVAYAHGVTAVNGAYYGAVYSPTQNRIYLVPQGQGNQTNWHYIDCATGNVVAYAHGVTAVNGAYRGGTYSPTQNRIYLVPDGQGNQANWHYISSTAEANLAPHYFGSTILSSTL
jgi:hypothetical protein